MNMFLFHKKSRQYLSICQNSIIVFLDLHPTQNFSSLPSNKKQLCVSV